MPKSDKISEKYIESVTIVNNDPFFQEYMSHEEDQRKMQNSLIREAEDSGYEKGIKLGEEKLEQNKFIKNKREKQRIEDNYSALQAQHAQASRELSKSKHLSNENYRKWNSSAYTYNPSKRRFEFDKNLGRSADVPKYINDRR